MNIRRTLLHCRRGVASVETAIVVSVMLIPLCLGALDKAAAEAVAARLDRSLQNALFYIWANPTSFTNSGVQSAVSAAYGSAAPSVTATATQSCSCVSNGYNPVSPVSCAATCPSGQTIASYATIVASTTYAVPATLPGISPTVSLSVTGTVRTK